MDLLFKNTTKYSKQLYLSFLNFHNLKFGMKYNLFSIFIIIICILGIVLQLSYSAFIPAITLTIILILFVIYRYSFSTSKVSKELKSKKISEGKDVTFCFYDNHIEVFNGNNGVTLNYKQIYKVFELPDFFYIYISKQYALLVSKNGFTVGNYLDFSEFLKKKCWRKYKVAFVQKEIIIE